ncbi:MAG: hypothetical protein ACD_79C00504G0004 [uncultured bacterium]|nr:MAG: hypothetical protein ACD_79C00504G0004 [uncultured bacterium]
MIVAEQITLQQFKKFYYLKFKQLFINEYGFIFNENRIEAFKIILQQFLVKTSYKTFDDFYDYLKSVKGKKLLKEIIDEVIVGETYFFRNIPQLDLLKEKILPALIAAKRSAGVNTIKIWSAGCSTGEEVYTLAMLIYENIPTANLWDIKIAGTDINEKSLKTAMDGVYKGARPQRHLDEEILKKYFDVTGQEYVVKPKLRSISGFQYNNLAKLDPPPLIDPDIIFCRNVTIYFDNDVTRKIINNFYEVLHDGGYLFLGHSETIWKICPKFKILDFPKGFVYQKLLKEETKPHENNAALASIPEFDLDRIADQNEILHIHFTKPLEAIPKLEKRIVKEEVPLSSEAEYERLMKLDSDYHKAVQLFERKQYDSALEYFDDIIKKDKKYILAHFAKSTILSNIGKYKEAFESLEFLITSDNLFLDAYFLKGVLHLKLNELENAIQTFQKVIYLDPEHSLASFHLAKLYIQTNRINQAKITVNNLKKICAKHDKKGVVPLSDNLTYENLEVLTDKLFFENQR